MNRTEKTELANVLGEKFKKAKLAVFADYKGLTAGAADDLRSKLRKVNCEVKVIKNNIARIAAKDGQLGDETKSLLDTVVGPTVVAFSYGDTAAAAKIVKKFSEENEAFVIKSSLMEAKRVEASDVAALADLPSKEVLVAMLLGVMNAPARNFVSVLAAVPRGLVTVLDAIGKKKGGAS